jgi:DNA-binding SARP family transcriptional activator
MVFRYLPSSFLSKMKAFIFFLACTAGGHPRDELQNIFWSEYDPNQGRTNLRHNLYLLRKALAGNWIEADRETIRFNPGSDTWLDLEQFNSRLAECHTHGHAASEYCPACIPPLTAAAGLYRGDFLRGFSLKDSIDFDNWQLFQTESLRREYASVLEKLVECHYAQGAFEGAIDYARRWLALDRLNEAAHCHGKCVYFTGPRGARRNAVSNGRIL